MYPKTPYAPGAALAGGLAVNVAWQLASVFAVPITCPADARPFQEKVMFTPATDVQGLIA